MMDKCKLFQRLVAGVLCAGLLVGYVPAEARAAEDDTQVVDSVFADVMEVEKEEAEPVSETETAIFSWVLPIETSGSSQVRNLTAVQSAQSEVATVADFTVTISADHTESYAGGVTLTAAATGVTIHGYYWTEDTSVTPATGDFTDEKTYLTHKNGTFYCWVLDSNNAMARGELAVTNITNHFITHPQDFSGYMNERATFTCEFYATAGSYSYACIQFGYDLTYDVFNVNKYKKSLRVAGSYKYYEASGVYTATYSYGYNGTPNFLSYGEGPVWFQLMDSNDGMLVSETAEFRRFGPTISIIDAQPQENGKWLLTAHGDDPYGDGVAAYYFSKVNTTPPVNGAAWQENNTKEVDGDELWYCWAKSKSGYISRAFAMYAGEEDVSDFTYLPVSVAIYASETRGIAPLALLAPGAQLDYFTKSVRFPEIVSDSVLHSEECRDKTRTYVVTGVDWVVGAKSGAIGITKGETPLYGASSVKYVAFRIIKSTGEVIWSPTYTVTQYAPTVESVSVVCPNHVNFTVTAHAKDGKDYGVRNDAEIKYYYFSRSATNPSPSSKIGYTDEAVVDGWTTNPVLETTQDGTWYCWAESSTGYISAAKTFTLTSKDETPPVMQSLTAASYTNGTVTLTAEATDDHADGVHKFYAASSTDGTVPTAPTKGTDGWKVSTTANTLSWQETITKDTTFYVWAMDFSGNVSKDYKSVKVGYDVTAPEIVSVTPVLPAGSTEWTCGPVSFKVEVSDNIGVAAAAVTSSNATYAPGDGWTTTKNADGTFTATLKGTGIINNTTMYIWIKDVAGNTVYTTYDVKHEKVAPTATISVSRTEWGTGDVTINITNYADTGGSGEHATPYSYDGGATWTADASKTFSAAQTVTVKVRDNAGNALSQTVQIKVDKAAPKISKFDYTCATPGEVKLTVTAADQATGDTASGIAGYYLKAVTDGSTPTAPAANDSGWVESTQGTYSWDETINQNVTYYVWAKDQVGNVSALTQGDDGEYTASVKFVRPAIGFSIPTYGGPYNYDFVGWYHFVSYGGTKTFYIDGEVIREGSSKVDNWQWQRLMADGVTWENISEDVDDNIIVCEKGYSPTTSHFAYRFGYDALSVETTWRVAASGDWGTVYSPSFNCIPQESVRVSAKALLSGTSDVYTNGSVDLEITLTAPRFQEDSGIYGYCIGMSSSVPALSDFIQCNSEEPFTVNAGTINADTAFYVWSKTTVGALYPDNLHYGSGVSNGITIKYDAKAPTVTATADGQAKTITVTAEDVAEGNSGASGIKAFAIHTGVAPVDGDWVNCAEVTAEETHVFTELTSGTTYYVSVKDDAGNVTTQSVYLPYYSATSVQLSITDATTPSYGKANLNLPGVTYTSIQVTAPSGVTLTDGATVQAGYKTWGTTSANSKLALVLGTKSGDVALTSGTTAVSLSDIQSITLYNAAAYTIQENRTFTITLTNAGGDTAVITVTVKGISSKVLNMDVSLASGEISLQPGTSAQSVSDGTSSITNNNPYPISLTMSGITAAEGSPTVITGTPDKTKELKSAGVQVGIRANDQDSYYTGSAISIGNLGATATQQFNYLMKFSPLYTGAGNESISYNVSFGVSVSAEDMS